jgi:hypothetical protein
MENCMTDPRAQHKATLSINGRSLEIHAPPFASIAQLEAWLAPTLENPDVTLVTKSWATTESTSSLDPTP